MKQFLLLMGMAVCAGAYAQLPRWMIEPQNDTVYVKVDNALLQSDSNGASTLWTMDGKQLYQTDQTIMPFQNGVATIVDGKKNQILGFVDAKGNVTTLPNLPVAYGYPYFDDGLLPYVNSSGYGFYTLQGTKAKYPDAAKAYPFHQGYSPYLTYENLEKKKNPHYAYAKANGEDMQYFTRQKDELKSIEPLDIRFLSGIGTDGRGVAVIKDKLYWFDTESGIFEPFLRGDEESEKKRHLRLSNDNDYDEYFTALPNDSIRITARYGKESYADLVFDSHLRPMAFTFDDGDMTFEPAKGKPVRYDSDLAATGSGPYGLRDKNGELLPEQFEQVGLLYANKALVKMDGKWGVIEIRPKLNYILKINDGEDVAFRHQKFNTKIRLDLPTSISSKNARITIPENSGWNIDYTSRETKDTESGNFVAYDCVLDIPKSLPDTITEIDYEPLQISYDNIKLFKTPVKVRAWHLKYYNVDPIESETSIANGVASFTININAQKNDREKDYPFEIKVEADSVHVEYEKLSETRYKYLVSNLQEGTNNLSILVIEQGCPPSVFPFEIQYTRPVPKKKQKEQVVVRKKSPIRIPL